MNSAQIDFDSRLRVIQKRRARFRRGMTYRVGRNGLIIAQPRSRLPELPIRGLALLALALFAIKVGIFLVLGPTVYAERLDLFSLGTPLDQYIATALQPDVVTLWIAEQVPSFLR